MKGNILDYNFQESKGIISGTDGKRYTFENSEWRCNTSPIINQLVDFDIDEQNAKNIYLDKTDYFIYIICICISESCFKRQNPTIIKSYFVTNTKRY